jgi:hypothetical protein
LAILEIETFMQVIDNLMLFVSSLDSIMLGIGNMVYKDQKQCV